MIRKTIKSETITTKHKKTKNFLIVLIAIGLLFVLFGSFFSVYLNNQKSFQKKEKKEKSTKIQTEIVDNQEVKESWASSVERRLKENQGILAKGITAAEKSFREDAQRRENKMDQKFEQLQSLIKLSQNTIESKLKKNDARLADIERRNKENLTKITMEMRKLKEQSFHRSTTINNDDASKPFLPPLMSNINKSKYNPQKKNTSSKENVGEQIYLPALKNSVKKSDIKLPKEKSNTVVIKKAVDMDKLAFVVEDEINPDIEKNYPLKKEESEIKDIAPKKYELGLGFFDAINLTGAYAPIFGQASDQASIPVLLEVSGDMIIANGFTESVDKCFALGGAIGNPSSNTVDIRLSTIECVLSDGKHKIRGKIKGWVIGENGKPGLAGTLIHKSGQYISRFILAGLLQSLSTAFVTAATPSGTQGPATSVITGGAVQGAAQGTQNAFGKLADFYIKLAEKTLPMIEAKAGRHISVLIQGGDLYEVKDFNPININDLFENYKNKGQE